MEIFKNLSYDYDKLVIELNELVFSRNERCVINGNSLLNKEISIIIVLDSPSLIQLVNESDRNDLLDNKTFNENSSNICFIENSKLLKNFNKEMSYYFSQEESNRPNLRHLLVSTVDSMIDVLTDNIEIVVRNSESGEILCEYRIDFDNM